MNEIMNYVQECLLSIILALLSLGTIFIIQYINKLKDKIITETNKIEDKALQELFNDSINQLDKLVKTTVYSIEQEIASEIRKKLEAGDPSVSREDLVALRDKAYEIIITTINPEVIVCVSGVIENVEEYILNKISEEVKNLKDSNNV